MSRTRPSLALLMSMLGCAAPHPVEPAREATPAPEARVTGLVNIQRTMRLLQTSTKERRNAVRILFYGQSITEANWSRRLENMLHQRFPYADLHVENRALGGFAAQLLISSAETDLYPYYPDLVIFHVFGAHDRYEEIFRRIRSRTTAEILHQTDHVIDLRELTEERDPDKLAPKPEIWSAFMNHAFLPSLVTRYETALCDQREAWKRYLTAHQLPPGALLRDGVHLNGRGDVLMSDLVESCMKVAPELGPSPAEAWVTTYEVGKHVQVRDNLLVFPFTGNRVDVLTAADAGPDLRATVLIDGKPPSAFASSYGFTRAHADPSGKWPPVFDLSSEAPLILEDWTLHLTRVDAAVYTFEAIGTKTGPDGRGRTDSRFVSRSRRLVIEPTDWNLPYALELGGTTTPPDELTITFRVTPYFTDAFAGAAHDPAYERAITVASALPNGPHTLTLTFSGETKGVTALRVYRPPLTQPN